jgi:hypothetical protein
MFPRMTSLVSAFFISVATALPTASLPPPPEDGIRDNAHALEEETHARMADAFRRFEAEHDVKLWFCAVTFVPDSQPLRSYARELRQAWSGEGDAIVIGYDRVSDSQSLSFSPAVWNRYPTADLIMLMQAGARIVANQDVPLDQRLEKSVMLTLDRLRELERERARMTHTLPASHLRLAKACTGVLAAGSLGLLVICGAARKREARARWHLLFPEVQVAQRFGAPRGGGVTVQHRAE